TYADVGIATVEPSLVSTNGGTEVTFRGLGFAGDMSFRIGGQPVTALQVLDSSEARARSPVLPAGEHDVELFSSGGLLLWRLPGAVTALVPAPLGIASVTPNRVFSLGGAEITV